MDQPQLPQDREGQRDRYLVATDARGHVTILERLTEIFLDVCHERLGVWLARNIEVQVFGQPGESVQLAQTRATGERVASIVRMAVHEGQNLVLQGLFQPGAQGKGVEALALLSHDGRQPFLDHTMPAAVRIDRIRSIFGTPLAGMVATSLFLSDRCSASQLGRSVSSR